MKSTYLLLSELTVIVHFAYILFVAIGQVMILLGWYFKWDWVRNCLLRMLHLAAIALVAIEAWLGAHCPLTLLENHFRRLAGVAVHDVSFVSRWMNWLIYYDAPAWVFTTLYTALLMIVLLCLTGYPPRCGGNSDQAGCDG